MNKNTDYILEKLASNKQNKKIYSRFSETNAINFYNGMPFYIDIDDFFNSEDDELAFFNNVFVGNDIGLSFRLDSMLSEINGFIEKQSNVSSCEKKFLSDDFILNLVKIVTYQYDLKKYCGESGYLYISHLFKRTSTDISDYYSDLSYYDYSATMAFFNSKDISNQLNNFYEAYINSEHSNRFYGLPVLSYLPISFLFDLKDINEVLLTKGSGGDPSEIIDDDDIYYDKTWSSQKIRNEIDTASPTMHTLTINVEDESYEYDGSSNVTINLFNAEGELF